MRSNKKKGVTLMKGTLETIITTAIERLSLSTILAILPIAIAVYLFIYVEDHELEKVFGWEQTHPPKDNTYTCPNCGYVINSIDSTKFSN